MVIPDSQVPVPTPYDKKETPKRDMTVREAGKRGGEEVKRRYGLDFFSEIGKKGGDTVAEERGREHYAKIGAKGGKAKRKHQRDNNPSVNGEDGDTFRK